MRKLTFTNILFFLFLLQLPSLGQSLQWQSEIGIPDSLDDNSEFKAAETGPDGKIYSTGYFTGVRTKIGNTFLYADMVGFYSIYQPSWGFKPLTAFVACHEVNGTLSWAKTIHTHQGALSPTIGDLTVNLAGAKIAFDTQGNLLVAGIANGDTLYFNGQAFEFNTTPPSPTPTYPTSRVFLLKLSPSGNLIWGRSIPFSNSPSTLSPEVRYLGYHNGAIELLSNKFEASTQIHKNTLYRYSDAGVSLGTKTYTQTSPDFSGGKVLANYRYPNGKFLLAQYSEPFIGLPTPNITRLSLLQADLTEIENHKICLFSAINQAVGGNGPIPCYPSSLRVLPDGQIAIVLTLGNAAMDMQLIFDNDTLALPQMNSTFSYTSIFIRLSQLGCMKKIETFGYFSDGEMAISPNGNSFGLSHRPHWNMALFPNDPASLVAFDKNGISLSLSNLSFLTYVRPYNSATSGFPISIYNLKWTNNGILGITGNKLIKLSTLPDPVVSDNSFSGCLSDRNIALSTSNLSKDNRLHLVRSALGELYFEGIPSEGVSYKLINTFGQTIKAGQLNASTSKLAIVAQPTGIYYLHVKPIKGNPYSFKVRI